MPRRPAVALAFAAACAGAFAQPASVADDTPAHWQRLARQDILAAHQALLDAHPGAIDAQNPGFHSWLEAGATEALAVVPRVRSYDDLLSAVRLYTSGFRDVHLGYSDDARLGPGPVVDGWHVVRRGGAAVVDAVAPDWPAPLPPLGARLLGCDGHGAGSLLARDVQPFVHASAGDAGEALLWNTMTRPPLDEMRWRTCRFRTAAGAVTNLRQAWRDVPWDSYRHLMAGSSTQWQHGTNAVERLPDGTLWIRAGNFQPTPDETAALERLLESLRNEPAARRIVFDARGNRGGSSVIGQRLLEAATGGLAMDESGLDGVAVTSAWWRVSDIGVANLASAQATLAQRGGDETTQRIVTALSEAMAIARARGEAWVHQPDGDMPRLTRADLRARHAHLRRPVTQVALLTDENCVSACLDFADAVRANPGALHIGRTTGADTVYLEAAHTPLPSGNTLVLPVKVWRNRVRGDNEPLVPDVPLRFDQGSEDGTRRAVIAILDRRLAAPP